MSPQNIAGYALQEALISHDAHVERWRAIGTQGPAEIFIMPKAHARSLSVTPQWGPFAAYSIHNLGNKAAIVVPGMLVENLPSLRRRLGPGPAVGFAWHISTHLSSLHDTGGSHGFLHSNHIGLNDNGKLVIRPAFAAKIAPDPDKRASAQASDCWQMGFLMAALGLEPTMDERIGLLMAGLSRDMAMIRLQPARAIRQALSAVAARNPDWEAKLLADLGSDWGLDQLPSIEDSIIPRIYPHSPRAPVPQRSPSEAYDFKSWESPFAEKPKGYEQKSALRDALRRNVESGRVLLPPVTPSPESSRIQMPASEIEYDVEDDYSAKIELKSATVAQIKIPLAANTVSVGVSATPPPESLEKPDRPQPISVQLESEPDIQTPSAPVSVSVDLSGPGLSFQLDASDEDSRSEESEIAASETEVDFDLPTAAVERADAFEEAAEFAPISTDQPMGLEPEEKTSDRDEGEESEVEEKNSAISPAHQEKDLSAVEPKIESGQDEVTESLEKDTPIDELSGITVSVSQELALSLAESNLPEAPVASDDSTDSNQELEMAPMVDVESASPRLRLPKPVPAVHEEIEEESLELPSEPQVASIDVNSPDLLASAEDNVMIQLPAFEGDNDEHSTQPIDDLYDAYGRFDTEQPYFSTASASLQLAPGFQMPAEPEVGGFTESAADHDVSDFASAFDGKERVAITVRTPSADVEWSSEEVSEDVVEIESPFESPLDELSDEESSSLVEDSSPLEGGEEEQVETHSSPLPREDIEENRVSEEEKEPGLPESPQISEQPDEPSFAAPRVQEFLELQERDGDELLLRRSAAQPKWMGIKGITSDPARETELGSGKWTASGRSLEDLKREMPDTPVRELEIFEHERNYTGFVLLLLILSGIAIFLLTSDSEKKGVRPEEQVQE